MVSLSNLLEICPYGAWVTEDLAVEVLGLASKEVLKTVFNEGALPHVLVEHGGRIRAPFPYNSHAFFFFQAEGTAATTPNLSLEDWLKICRGNPKNLEVADLIERYTTLSDPEEAFIRLKDEKAIVTSLAPGIAGSADYRYGTSGGIMPSKASSAGVSEIVTRADGVRVRRVKRSSSATANATSLAGFLSGSEDTPQKTTGSKSVSADGEIYIRADGKKVRRVKKFSASSGDPSKKSLDGFLSKDENGKTRLGGSASVAGDQIAVNKEFSLTGEVYVRADGKKVRRVRKTTASSAHGENVEIITRPDGTRVRRIRKTKPASDGSVSGGMSESQSVTDNHLEGEIYVRPDGKKVRRVRRVTGSGALTVSGSSTSQSSPSGQETEVESHNRPDGTKVGSMKTQAIPEAAVEQSNLNASMVQAKTLDGFLDKAASRPKVGGSASVAGDRIAVSKDESLTGEVYVRADGKKVRRIKKSSTMLGENVEIITRPDGTRVRRIRKTRPKVEDKGGDGLSGFLDSQPSLAPKGGAATVGGEQAPIAAAAAISSDTTDEATAKEAKAKKNLDSFLSTILSRPKKTGGSASVAGDMLAVDKNSSLTGEVYVRSDGKKVRRVRKITAVQPGDEVEIITRPDGTKVRRIRRAKKPLESENQSGKLDGFLGASSEAPKTTDGNATVTGDMLHSRDAQGEIYIRADGKKVRRIRKTSSSAAGAVNEQYEIYIRPDGKKVRRIRRPKASTSLPSEGVQSSPVGTRASTLNEDDERIATQYRKMLKMGMPDGAVMQKMAIDGVAQNIQDSVLAKNEQDSALAREVAPPTGHDSKNTSSLSAQEEEIASHYRKMLKMGMPDGAVAQKMTVDGVSPKIKESVLARETPVPAGMALVPKDQATVSEDMVLVPKEQAARTIPAGMVAIPRLQASGETIPDGYVLVPKDQIKGDPGKDDLVLVRKEQVIRNKEVVLVSESSEVGLKRNTELNEEERDEIKGANIVSLDDLPSQVEALKQGSNGGGPRFLLQALPSDQEYQDGFIIKNLLPKKAAAPAPAAPSSSIAELLAQMSTMGGDFDAEKMGELLQKLESAEKRQKKLEKQLAQAGVAIAEDIDYEVCLKKVAQIGKRMGEIGGSDVADSALREEYFKLEQEMEKYNSALLLTDEYQAEQDRLEQKWEVDNAPENLEALKKLRRHMPVEVRNMSEAQLTSEVTPNGKYLPKAIAKKFKRTNVLQIIRRDPDDIVRMHPSTLENMRVTGLTLTERRGIYEHLRSIGPQWKAMKADKMTERKWTWYNMMKGNFKENLASYQRHVDQYGPPGAHPYRTRANPNEGCPLIGKQCPLKADKIIDYDYDYGFTDKAVYEVSDVKKSDADDPGAKAMQEALELMKEKKANERNDALKKHYKGKLLQVSKANGSCEQMDEIMDKMEYGMMKWLEDIVGMGDDKSKLTEDVKKKEVANFTDVLNDCKLGILDICGRSGMQLSGKKGGDTKADPRSLVECSLAEEVAEAFNVFTKFITNRLKQTQIADTRIKSTIEMLKGLLGELRERNVNTIKDLGGKRSPVSRKLKTQEVMEKEIKEKLNKAKAEEDLAGGGGEAGRGGQALPGPPRGGLMDAIKSGRGRGGGRGGLLDDIKGGRGGGGGRGGLLDAIKAGRGRGGGGRGGGGRGGLLDAIKAGRGRGRGGGDGGGRGGLLAAIQARGGG